MLLGSLVGLISALTWALTTVIVRPLLGHAGLGASNAVRFIVSLAIITFLGAFTSGLAAAASLDLRLYLLLLCSTTASLIIGDSAYFVASQRIGVARALPISMSYPLLTAVVAVLFLGEPSSLALWIGAFLIVAGATVLGLPISHKAGVVGPKPKARWDLLSIALAVLAAVGWAASVVILKLVVVDLAPIPTNIVRVSFAMIISLGLALSFPRLAGDWPKGRWLVWTILAGVGTVASTIFFVWAVDLAGAARASLLNAAAPLFAAPIARFVLAEPIAPRTLVGIAATVVGVMLVVY